MVDKTEPQDNNELIEMLEQMKLANSYTPRGLVIDWPKVENFDEERDGVYTGSQKATNFIGRGDLCNVFG